MGIRKFFIIAAIILFGVVMPISWKTPAFAANTTVRILLVGNSLTRPGNNPMSYYLRLLGSAGGYTFSITTIAYNGEKMRTYANPDTERGKELRKTIRSEKWNYIVLQEHTDWAIAHPVKMRWALRDIAAYIKRRCPSAKILLNATWAYTYTRRVSGVGYRYSTQQKLINKHYETALEKLREQYGNDRKIDIIHSGNAFRTYMAQEGHLNLYKADGNHPSNAGAYMNACCIYKCTTGRSPYGLSYYGGLGRGRGRAIQRVALNANR